MSSSGNNSEHIIFEAKRPFTIKNRRGIVVSRAFYTFVRKTDGIIWTGAVMEVVKFAFSNYLFKK